MVIFALLIQAVSSLPTDASALASTISALESDIKTLESSSVPLEHRLPLFTGVVVLGVAMELWVIWHERRDEMVSWRRGIISSPARPSTIRFLVQIASVLLITGGIVGELWIGIRITSINGALRDKNEKLRNCSDELVGQINERAKNAELETERLRKQVSWRHLGPEQRADLVRYVKRFRGQRYDILIPEFVDPEPGDFADSLEIPLGSPRSRSTEEAGWIQRARGNVPVGVHGGVATAFSGVEVSISKSAKPLTREAGLALVSWLNSRGIAATAKSCFRETCHEYDPKIDFDNVLVVVIGRRP